MAEALLGVVTEAVLAKVISLGNQQISGLLGMKDDLQSLAKKLEMIQALLSDAESKSTTSKTIEIWLKDLEIAAADADDLLDEFAYEILSKKLIGKKEKVCSFFSSSNPILFRCTMVSKIKKIKFQINEIFNNATQIGLRPVEVMNFPSHDPRKVTLTDPFVDDSKIVGRDDDVRKLMDQLAYLMDEKDLSVIGIVGMAGQGKTALAQLLMKNDEVSKHFQKRIWTCVSDDFNVERVLDDMLQSLTGGASGLTNREAIVKKLSKELVGKRFLLVFDDVWNENSQLWDQMNNCLQAIGGSRGSKIVVTTRNEAVVTIMNGFVYRLGVLSRKASLELFERIAFGNGRKTETPHLVEIGERIVARCGGLPLALKAIGGLMSSQRDELEWLKIEESTIWGTLDAVQSAIMLSFNHLPSLSLKQCFAYCSIFPKDSGIRKKNLIQQWMAHGLLNPSRGSTNFEMEDVGNNYFKILLQRSFLQETKFDLNGNIVSCKMHDLVHDFAVETSKGHCLITGFGALNDDIKAEHLSIVPDHGSHALNNIVQDKKLRISRLRTLHITSGPLHYENFLVDCKFEHLRVFVLIDGKMKELSISIAKLKHLRYLDISRTRIRVLPDSFSRLYNLLTLRLPLMRNLPKSLGRLVNLRHLYINERYYAQIYLHLGVLRYHSVPGIGRLTSLRSLSCFWVGQDKGYQIEELCGLNHLEGTIRIAGLENVADGDDAKRANISEKRNIESLELLWTRTSGTAEGSSSSSKDERVLEGLQPHVCLKSLSIVNFMGKSLPSWILLLRNLINMELRNLANLEQIPPLGHLPHLKILRIRDMNKVKCVGKGNDFYGSSTLAFPSLKELILNGMSSLEEWSDIAHLSSYKLFPSLEKLEIKDCPCLIHLPEGLLSASTGLERLMIQSCDNLVSVPDLSSLQSLKELCTLDCPELSLALPEGIEACKSLQTLSISYNSASVMKSLPNYLKELTLQLSNNNIVDLYNVTEKPVWDNSLQYLRLIGLPELKSLPEKIQNLTALRALTIEKFDGLEALPEWLGNLHSLESLNIKRCKSLGNFPSMEAMTKGLINLKSLTIWDCPIMKQRCEKESNAGEWNKISHIPNISME